MKKYSSEKLSRQQIDIERPVWNHIYIDEIDKITRKSECIHYRDVSGEGVQQALLKILEEQLQAYRLREAKHPHQEFIQIDTTNILFICGAFEGIEKLDRSQKDTKSIGFGAEVAVKEERNVVEF